MLALLVCLANFSKTVNHDGKDRWQGDKAALLFTVLATAPLGPLLCWQLEVLDLSKAVQ